MKELRGWTRLAGGLLILFVAIVASGPVQGGSWWQQSVNVESKVGTDRSIQSLDVMYPLSHSSSSLLFTDLRGRIDDDDSVEFNLGLAHRFVAGDPLGLSDEAVFGYYGFADRLESQFNNTFYQGTVGAEYFTEDYSLRLNGYLPEDERKPTTTFTELRATGTQIFFEDRTNFERPLPGYDAELGRTFRFDGWQLYGRGSYFRFHHSDATEVEGSRYRAGIQFDGSHPEVYLPEESQLTLGLEWQEDNVREEQTFGVVRFRVPFGTGIEDRKSNIEKDESNVEGQQLKVTNNSPSSTSQGSATSPTRGEEQNSFSPSMGEKRKEGESPSTGNKDVRPLMLDVGLKSWQKDRLTERIERDVDIVTGQTEGTARSGTEPAVLQSTGQSLDNVAVARSGASGSGRISDPANLASAVDAAGTDGTVFVTDEGGTFSLTSAVPVYENQSLIGGGTRLAVRTPDGEHAALYKLGEGKPSLTREASTGGVPALRLVDGSDSQYLRGLRVRSEGTGNLLAGGAIHSTNNDSVTIENVIVETPRAAGITVSKPGGDWTLRNTSVRSSNRSVVFDQSTADVTVRNVDLTSSNRTALEVLGGTVDIAGLDVKEASVSRPSAPGVRLMSLSDGTMKNSSVNVDGSSRGLVVRLSNSFEGDSITIDGGAMIGQRSSNMDVGDLDVNNSPVSIAIAGSDTVSFTGFTADVPKTGPKEGSASVITVVDDDPGEDNHTFQGRITGGNIGSTFVMSVLGSAGTQHYDGISGAVEFTGSTPRCRVTSNLESIRKSSLAFESDDGDEWVLDSVAGGCVKP